MKPKLKIYLVLLLVLFVQISFAQERTVTGNVTDNNGVPLPGASVVIKGTMTGTETDFDGNFSIQVSPKQTLVFSYIGMIKQEFVASSTKINVKLLENAQELEGVVVTALGIKRSEKALGYSVQNLKGEGMNEARESNLVNALSGKVAGIQVTNSSGAVGSSSRVVLRGNSSITGNNQPLFVVDGVPFDNTSYGNAGSGGGRDLPNGVASINPDDIESVTVLKGPNAAALYGLRASNGVIVITTKKGKSSKTLGISFNSNIAFSNPLILPKYQNSYGQGSSNNGTDSVGTYFEFVDGEGGGSSDGVDESWGAPLDVGLQFVQWDSYKVGGAPLPWVSRPDNIKNFYNTGIAQTNNISFTGGGDKSNFRFSVGNSDEKGMVPFTEFKKFSVSGNGNLILSDKITAGLSMNYFNDRSDNLATVGYAAENVVQQFIWSARNVNYTDLKDWRNLPLAPSSPAGAQVPLNWNNNFQNNPYWVLENNKNTFNRDRLNGNVNLNYQITKAFSVAGKLTLDHYSQVETIQKAIGTNESIDGSFQVVNRRYKEINSDFLFGYKKSLSEDFEISLNAGANSLQRTYTGVSVFAPGLELPFLYNLSNIKTGSTPIFGNTYQETRINSLLGFGQLAYKGYLFLDFTARNDWSSLLPVANNSFFYPSVSGSAIISDMVDIKSSKIDYLKIRASWAKVGGTGALDPYSINSVYGLSNNGWGNQANTPNTQFNPNLKPESVSGVEFGFDINAFSNRVRLAFTYYNQESNDLIVPIDIFSASGFTSSWENIGSMVNKGKEIQLGLSVIKSKDFTFDIDLNYAKNQNEVVSLKGLDSYVLGGQWGVTLEARPGLPYGALVGRGYERNDNGDIIYENGLPVVDNTPKVLGNITPDWTGGANFAITYKGFDLSTLIDAKVGGDIHSMSYAWGRYAGTLEESLIGRETGVVGSGVMSDGNGGWVPNNVVVEAKSFNQTVYGNNLEESAIFDATYIKLRQIIFGYTLPNKWLKGTAINSVKLSVVGRNLALLYKKAPHIDPESAFSSANGEQGQEFGQLPSARSIGFNLNIKF